MTIKAKAVRVLTWALGAVLVSAGVAWAATLWRVDSYGNIKAARSTVLLAAGQASNCKLDVTGTTLSIVGTNDAALSTSNPCIVGLTDGMAASFTAPVAVTFGAASDTDGNLFGIADVNWANTMPMFLRVISDGTSHYFGISRIPMFVSGSAAADLCQLGDTDCDAETDFMILASGLNLANWTEKSIFPAGWFGAIYTTAGGAWTFSTAASITGFNDHYKFYWVKYPKAQKGAGADNYLSEAGAATGLAFNTGTSMDMGYRIQPNGWVDCYWIGGTRSNSDATAALAYMHLPFESYLSTRVVGGTRIRYGTVANWGNLALTAGASYGIISTDAGGNLNVANFSDANDSIMSFSFGYQTRAVR